MINITNLTFKYSPNAPVVLEVPNFQVNKGDKLFLYGPSGCGKTTFLEILAGVLVPQTGRVEILQKDLVNLSLSARDHFRAAHIGYIFQSFNLIPYLNVIDNITLPCFLNSERMTRVSDILGEATKLCQQLRIDNLLTHTVTHLSVGQQQRVAVARALLGRPELILADEPTSALDSDHREKFIEALFEVCQKNNTTVIFVSHDRSLQQHFDRSVSLPEINKARQHGEAE